MSTINVIKKDGTLQEYDEQKIINAVNKSANRALFNFTKEDYGLICNKIFEEIEAEGFEDDQVPVAFIHSVVEKVLLDLFPDVGQSYQQYRNYKLDFVAMMDEVYEKSQAIMYIGDKDNANTDSALVATKRSLVFNVLNKELYKKFFMTTDERQACNDGYIYIHDMSARRDTFNCFRRDTRFITKKGIKSFYDFNDGDETMVLSHKGIWRKAIVHKYGHQEIQKVVFKKGTSTSKEVEVYCTPNHTWILKDGTRTTDLKEHDILYSIDDSTSFNWDELSLEDKQLWCKGFAKGDGSISSQKSRQSYVYIRLCGDKSKYLQRFIDAGYSITQPESYCGDYMVTMLSVKDKSIPWLELNYNNVLYYINGLLCADGNRRLVDNPTSEFKSIQVTGELNDVIYDLLNMAGYYVSSTNDLTNQETNYGIRKNTTIKYQISSSQQGVSAWRVKEIVPEKLNPKAEVWCLEVEEDHSFILEGGIPTGNCCLARLGVVMKDGFEMGNVWYNEPKTLDVSFDVMGDFILSTAAQQYGGFTIPRVDSILAPYAEKSYKKYFEEYEKIYYSLVETIDEEWKDKLADEYACEKVKRDFEQGWQGIEMKLNTVGSSRGDYPFVTMTFGLDTSRFGKMASITFLNVHKEGQGKEGFKKPVLFPKLVFLYDKNLHGEGCVNEDVFNAGVECSMKTMYPDWLSLSGEGYIPSMYKKYGEVVSPMGCRAFLSPWYERGGMEPADEDDRVVFEGRFNLGVVSLHLPMILAKARNESKDFYEVLDYYMEMIRGIHKRTYDYLGELKASVNPVAFCEGGLYGGNLKPTDKIKSILKPMTLSYGITALNELQQLYNGKSIAEDGKFAIEVMEYINKKINEYKKEDGILYAIYGTPAESLCGLQVKQFRKKYGIIENVSDREYVSNSFHCHVTEDITPIEKQDLEGRFWNLLNGGKIQYCRYPVNYNKEAVVTLIRRAMELGYYEGVNLELAYCEDCGYEQLEMDVCPKCGSKNLTKVSRMNGYLGYTRVHGDTRYNAAKMAEIADRKSM